ncbi:MAG: hypothetical protein EA376_00450 [Phycisphaeraceae bacterium]|nr:MAG: hypothetical protein EA376_00450 [Phycisphaeraceae bacterium]
MAFLRRLCRAGRFDRRILKRRCSAAGVGEDDLDRNYTSPCDPRLTSPCDPRLNYQQSLELALRIAQRMGRKRNGEA